MRLIHISLSLLGILLVLLGMIMSLILALNFPNAPAAFDWVIYSVSAYVVFVGAYMICDDKVAQRETA